MPAVLMPIRFVAAMTTTGGRPPSWRGTALRLVLAAVFGALVALCRN